jgi:DNA-binding winged helix-turn-helix (wHTH) protein
MAVIYLLDDIVEFHANEHYLINLQQDQEKIPLNSPASRCFQLLIENRGSIIEQKMFFEKVWNKHGTYVSANTFYQNISILRRGLVKAGLSDDIVKTVSRKGLTLSKTLNVKVINYALHEKIEPQITSELTEKNEEQHETEQTTHPHYLVNISKISMLIIGLALTGATVFYYINQPDSYFSQYQKIKSIGDCQFFIKNPTVKINLITQIIDNLQEQCHTFKNYYITSYTFSPRLSIIKCKEEINSAKKHHCISEYYIIDTQYSKKTKIPTQF